MCRESRQKRSLAYIDHNMLQSGFENADDHKYIETVAKKHGVFFSRPGNGICHQVNLERFGIPGRYAPWQRQPYPDRRRHRHDSHRRGRA